MPTEYTHQVDMRVLVIDYVNWDWTKMYQRMFYQQCEELVERQFYRRNYECYLSS